MKNKDNKVHVSATLGIIAAALPLTGLFGYIMAYVIPSNTEIDLGMSIVFIVFFLVLPVGIYIWIVIEMFPVIFFDEKGLHKSLFGVFLKKTILWEEIKGVKVLMLTGSVTSWIYFSKSNLTGLSIHKCNLKRDKIRIMNIPKVQNLVLRFSGKSVEEWAREYKIETN